MARYVVGDIQGCFDEFKLLLDKISYSKSRDQLFLVGDIVNRGPNSLGMLRWIYHEQEHVKTVLGNHDLHLLACAVGAATPRLGDTIEQIINAEDSTVLLEWLRKQPLLIAMPDALIVHAGILPEWGEQQALFLADDVSSVLSGRKYRSFLSDMYGNKPNAWSQDMQTSFRRRFAVNVFTRMRMVDQSGALDLRFKGELEKAPKQLTPWFDYPGRILQGRRIICGHWSALGLLLRPDICSLDTGCVWGGKLTALRLDDGEIFQVQALRSYQDLAD